MTADAQCGAPSQLSFNRAGTQLAGAGRSAGRPATGIACVWTVSTGALAYKATGYGHVLGAQFDPSNGHLVYATTGHGYPIQVGLVGATDGSLKGSLSSTTHMRANMEAVAVNATGHTIAVSYTDSGTIQFYDIVSHKWIVDVDAGVVGTTGTLTFSPNGSRIAHAESSGVTVVNTAGLASRRRRSASGAAPGRAPPRSSATARSSPAREAGLAVRHHVGRRRSRN